MPAQQRLLLLLGKEPLRRSASSVDACSRFPAGCGLPCTTQACCCAIECAEGTERQLSHRAQYIAVFIADMSLLTLAYPVSLLLYALLSQQPRRQYFEVCCIQPVQSTLQCLLLSSLQCRCMLPRGSDRPLHHIIAPGRMAHLFLGGTCASIEPMNEHIPELVSSIPFCLTPQGMLMYTEGVLIAQYVWQIPTRLGCAWVTALLRARMEEVRSSSQNSTSLVAATCMPLLLLQFVAHLHCVHLPRLLRPVLQRLQGTFFQKTADVTCAERASPFTNRIIARIILHESIWPAPVPISDDTGRAARGGGALPPAIPAVPGDSHAHLFPGLPAGNVVQAAVFPDCNLSLLSHCAQLINKQFVCSAVSHRVLPCLL